MTCVHARLRADVVAVFLPDEGDWPMMWGAMMVMVVRVMLIESAFILPSLSGLRRRLAKARRGWGRVGFSDRLGQTWTK